jgi:hypothetical protein
MRREGDVFALEAIVLFAASSGAPVPTQRQVAAAKGRCWEGGQGRSFASDAQAAAPAL